MVFEQKPPAPPPPDAPPVSHYIYRRLTALGMTWYTIGPAIGKSRTWGAQVRTGSIRVTEPEVIANLSNVLQINADDIYRLNQRVPQDIADALITHPRLVPAVRLFIRKFHERSND